MASYLRIAFLAAALAFMAAPPAHATYCMFYCNAPGECEAAVAPACLAECCNDCSCNVIFTGTACACS